MFNPESSSHRSTVTVRSHLIFMYSVQHLIAGVAQ